MIRARRLIAVAVLSTAVPAVWFGAAAAADISASQDRVDTAAPAAKRGPRGPRGPRGTRGPAGPRGLAGIASISVVDGPATPQCPNGGGTCQVASSEAVCPTGSAVVGGGFETATPDNVVGYAKRINPTTYAVIAVNWWAAPSSIKAQAICASGPGLSATIASASRSELAAKLVGLRHQMTNR
jgi:hypothetical protein